MNHIDPIWIAVLGLVGTTIASIVSAVVALHTKKEVNGLHNNVNHKMELLLAATKALARLEGVAEEKARAEREAK